MYHNLKSLKSLMNWQQKKKNSDTKCRAFTYLFCFKLNELVLLQMLIPVAWYYFSEIFRSYTINHDSHQDMFIDNPALKLTRDWIFDLKKKEAVCGPTVRAWKLMFLSIVDFDLLRPEKLTEDII